MPPPKKTKRIMSILHINSKDTLISDFYNIYSVLVKTQMFVGSLNFFLFGDHLTIFNIN